MKPKFKKGDILQLFDKSKDYVNKLKIVEVREDLYIVKSIEETPIASISNVGLKFSRLIEDVDKYFVLDSTYKATQTFDKELEELLK
jgi:hypothetical protein